ncbi:hypothetical protein PHYBLDRAFT_70105 [Phycomyces blakesleeanus NRRL 1555(-)]|uniref:Uncharacterized protein n=1 Tax=Phycomyces blakesleeanus (strain ATCC 8743b / DSM 1359 / FGSC 10004 / NBRC 33097 / NRRL 1555) TaxID=763407 RepID=A0A163A7D8_PHYB8|nr:hypothetical protein PHYBLDRAFT_70105 [Phycomyces blakesleeanus NRRL 1555(-)]OAD71561.1 hypothetical protein PHYBLDRAFT_70105 [Phycomyces blakesleeanus NRRL 1555(-)]|eukprot:XP_018289601.1 hypothetical protein PHYBLDRAFT_70105 [Phycomyces blakesleeanus NRRL 1555(-)]
MLHRRLFHGMVYGFQWLQFHFAFYAELDLLVILLILLCGSIHKLCTTVNYVLCGQDTKQDSPFALIAIDRKCKDDFGNSANSLGKGSRRTSKGLWLLCSSSYSDRVCESTEIFFSGCAYRVAKVILSGRWLFNNWRVFVTDDS